MFLGTFVPQYKDIAATEPAIKYSILLVIATANAVNIVIPPLNYSVSNRKHAEAYNKAYNEIIHNNHLPKNSFKRFIQKPPY